MDLAESILKELVVLQSKNAELNGIIAKLEKESDQIINQFEQKISELKRNLRREQEEKERLQWHLENSAKESAKEREELLNSAHEEQTRLFSLLKDLEGRAETLTGERDRLVENLNTARSVHSSESESLKEEISQLNGQIDEIRKIQKDEIISLQETFYQQERDLQDKLLSLTKIITVKEEDIQVLNNSIIQLKEEYEHEEHEIRKKLAKTERTLQNLQDLLKAERKSKKTDLQERDNLIKELKQKNSNLSEEYKKSQIESDKIYRSLRDDFDIAQENYSLLLKNYDEVKAEYAIFKDEHDLLILDHNKQIEDIKTFQRQELDDLIYKHQKTEELYQQQISELSEKLSERSKEIESLNKDISSSRSAYESDISGFKDIISKLESEAVISSKKFDELLSDKERIVQESIISSDKFNSRIDSLKRELTGTKVQAEEIQKSLKDEMSILEKARNHLEYEIGSRDRMLQKREQEYRKELARLGHDMSLLKENYESRVNDLKRVIQSKDNQIIQYSTSNETLRRDLERSARRRIRVESHITDGDKNMAANLHHEIEELTLSLSHYEATVDRLSEKILSLDTENSRLSHLLIELESKKKGEGQYPEDGSDEELSLLSYHHLSADLLSDLEDPEKAPASARLMVSLGVKIVPDLLSLLRDGTIQQKIWAAVVLYELNDPRATAPLMNLLESEAGKYREKIWDAKTQLRSSGVTVSTGTDIAQSSNRSE